MSKELKLTGPNHQEFWYHFVRYVTEIRYLNSFENWLLKKMHFWNFTGSIAPVITGATSKLTVCNISIYVSMSASLLQQQNKVQQKFLQ